MKSTPDSGGHEYLYSIFPHLAEVTPPQMTLPPIERQLSCGQGPSLTPAWRLQARSHLPEQRSGISCEMECFNHITSSMVR